jgi:hypothetical protein
MSHNPFGGLDPNEIFERLVNLGDEWADAHAAAALYEETQKSMLAQLTIRASNGGSRSVAAATNDALGTDEYQKFCRNMVLARRDANKKRVRYDTAKMWAELLRSANANRRAEMALGGMQT